MLRIANLSVSQTDAFGPPKTSFNTPPNCSPDVFCRTSSDHDQINVFAVTGWWREMNFVQERAPAHGDLGTQESIVEQCDHRPAQQKILLNLILRRPRHNGLVSQNILARDGRHNLNSLELLSTCQRSTSGMLSRLPLVGESVTRANLSSSVSDTPNVVGLRGILPFQLVLALECCLGADRSPIEAKSSVFRDIVAEYGELEAVY